MTEKADLSAALLELSALGVQLQEAAVGYRRQCEEQGFSPSAAEAMAVEYHTQLIRMLFAQVGKPQ